MPAPLGHEVEPEQVVPVLPPLLPPLPLLPVHVVPPELLPDDPRHALEQLCSSHVASGVADDEHALVMVPSQPVTLHASYLPPGHTHEMYAGQLFSHAASCELHDPEMQDQHAELTALEKHAPPELPPIPLLLPNPPLPLLLPNPPLLPPLPPLLVVQLPRLKPLHWLEHALQLPRLVTAEAQACETLEEHACRLHPLYEPPEHMQFTKGLHALSKVLREDPQLFWTQL